MKIEKKIKEKYLKFDYENGWRYQMLSFWLGVCFLLRWSIPMNVLSRPKYKLEHLLAE